MYFNIRHYTLLKYLMFIKQNISIFLRVISLPSKLKPPGVKHVSIGKHLILALCPFWNGPKIFKEGT